MLSSSVAEVGRPALVLLLPRESQEILDDVRCPLRFFLDDRKRLSECRGHIGDFSQEIRESHDGGEGVVEIVGDTGNELPNCRQFFRLDELVLQSPPLGLVVEEQHQGGAVGAGNRNRRNGIGLVSGTEIHFAAHSLLIQCSFQIGSPLGRDEGMPRPADQARRWGIYEVGKSPVRSPNPPAAVYNADGW